MLRSIKEIIGYTMKAEDGDIGKVSDFYFDDEKWTLRYMVADTGNWLMGRKVLISPFAFYGNPDWVNREFPLALSKEKIKKSPDIDAKRPVSRQKELDLNAYYNWPLYWHANPLQPVSPSVMQEVMRKEKTMLKEEEEEANPHLRSVKEIFRYHIRATDGEIGRVDDLIVDDQNWSARYFVIDTGGWLSDRKVLIAPGWMERADWAEQAIETSLTKKDIKESPPYDPSEPVQREYEERLYDYYERPKYW